MTRIAWKLYGWHAARALSVRSHAVAFVHAVAADFWASVAEVVA